MSPPKTYYFDNNATTCVAPEVLEAMLPLLTQWWGNPSSPYRLGREVARQVTRAREQVAALVNADPDEIVFTSCGTESINAALQSALRVAPDKRHVLTTAVEHSATVKCCAALEQRGYAVTYLPVGSDGMLDLAQLEAAMRPDTALVSVMWANNETGLLFPIPEIAARCRRRGVPLHTDAVQAPGKIALDVKAVEVDFLSLSAHKLYAPKGVGALYLRRKSPFRPYLLGGHQEAGRRAGTENAAGIVAFGRAAQLALAQLASESVRLTALRDRLEQELLERVPGTVRNGAPQPRLPNTTNLAFLGVEAEAVLLLLDRIGVCASSGSACTTGSLVPSHVLTALGLGTERARGSLRLSLGRYTTEEDVDYLLTHLPRIIARLREAGS
jgi:cysteine desulfurase